MANDWKSQILKERGYREPPGWGSVIPVLVLLLAVGFLSPGMMRTIIHHYPLHSAAFLVLFMVLYARWQWQWRSVVGDRIYGHHSLLLMVFTLMLAVTLNVSRKSTGFPGMAYITGVNAAGWLVAASLAVMAIRRREGLLDVLLALVSLVAIVGTIGALHLHRA